MQSTSRERSTMSENDGLSRNNIIVCFVYSAYRYLDSIQVCLALASLLYISKITTPNNF